MSAWPLERLVREIVGGHAVEVGWNVFWRNPLDRTWSSDCGDMNELYMGQVDYGEASKVLNEELQWCKHAKIRKRNKIRTTMFRQLNTLYLLLAG